MTPNMSAQSPSISFRKDIHGLRGVSVLLVLAFHFGLLGFEGGYLGVDIFFIISGYLITNLLVREKNSAGEVRLGQFYLRRVKRIFPAAIAVLAIFGAATAYLLPDRVEGVAKEMIWGVSALSNVFYAAQSDYFALSSEEFMFLNYWSLAVEEQFYLIWPLILAFGYEPLRNRTWLVGSVLTALFLISIIVWLQSISIGFYHIFGRWWELSFGAGLAIYESRSPAKLNSSDFQGNSKMNFLGLLLVMGALSFEAFQMSPHPLLPILLAAIGATLIIASRDRASLIAKALSLPIIQFFGTISFSLYLVHWPLKTLVFLYLAKPLSGGKYLGLFAISVLLASLLYYSIENPLRHARWRSHRFVSGVSLAALSVIGLSAFMMHGTAIAPTLETANRFDYAVYRTHLQKTCLAAPANYPGIDACRFGNMNRSKIDFWLVGDSHAEHWQPGLEVIAEKYNLLGVMYAMSAKLPIFDIRQYNGDEFMPNSTEWRNALHDNLQTAQPATVFLTARWALYYQTHGLILDPKQSFYATSSQEQPKNVETSRANIERELVNTIRDIQDMGHNVVLIGQVPEFGITQNGCVLRALENEEEVTGCGPSAEKIREFIIPAMEMLSRVEKATNVKTIFPHELLCDESHCALMLDETYLYRDDDHMNPEGAKKIVELLSKPILESFHKPKHR